MSVRGPLREAGIGLLFVAATANVGIYVIKAFKATYRPPPLSAWQGAYGEKPTNGHPRMPKAKRGTKQYIEELNQQTKEEAPVWEAEENKP